jgi:hypothetical protein
LFGIFVGSQRRELINDEQFVDWLNEGERAAWQPVRTVTKTFSGNYKAGNYRETVSDLFDELQNSEI